MLVGLISILSLLAAPVCAQHEETEPEASSAAAVVESHEAVGEAEGHGEEAVEEDPMLAATALPTSARYIGLAIFLVTVLLSIKAIRSYLGRLEEERQLGL